MKASAISFRMRISFAIWFFEQSIWTKYGLNWPLLLLHLHESIMIFPLLRFFFSLLLLSLKKISLYLSAIRWLLCSEKKKGIQLWRNFSTRQCRLGNRAVIHQRAMLYCCKPTNDIHHRHLLFVVFFLSYFWFFFFASYTPILPNREYWQDANAVSLDVFFSSSSGFLFYVGSGWTNSGLAHWQGCKHVLKREKKSRERER